MDNGKWSMNNEEPVMEKLMRKTPLNLGCGQFEPDAICRRTRKNRANPLRDFPALRAEFACSPCQTVVNVVKSRPVGHNAGQNVRKLLNINNLQTNWRSVQSNPVKVNQTSCQVRQPQSPVADWAEAGSPPRSRLVHHPVRSSTKADAAKAGQIVTPCQSTPSILGAKKSNLIQLNRTKSNQIAPF